MTGHEIVWTHDQDQVRQAVVCNEPAEADCRQQPSCQCEEYSSLLRDDEGAYHEHIGYDDDDEEVTEKHRHEPGGDCNYATWLNQEPSEIPEMADTALSFEIGRTPVAFSWTGDFYEWSPAQGAAA